MSNDADDTDRIRGQAQAGGGQRRRGNIKPTGSRLAVIEKLLRSPVDMVIDGRATIKTTVAAISYRLLQASLAGDKKASRVLQKFDEFASQHSVPEFEIVFVDNEYTRAFAASREGKDV